ncbi:MAG: prepilin-type N-terminal cleavage/methylation domain-containing protein [Clostridiaceae bacterium]|nr:prepilin-type N-terminal cleavage/methylation domain-containing protein [Clostridiaceae bacterium]
MKRKGFTYIEVMIAISIFAILILMIMRLNITSEKNLNSQFTSQKMMFVAQQQIESFKNTVTNNIGSYPNGFQLDSSGYYIVVKSDNKVTNDSVTTNTNLYQVTVWIRKNPTDNSNEIKLQSHVLKN